MLNRRRLVKLAQQPSTTDRAIAAAPGVGAVMGGAWGVLDPKAFNPTGLMPRIVNSPYGFRGRLVSGILGAGLGASTGALPMALRDTYRATRPPPATQQNIPKVAHSSFLDELEKLAHGGGFLGHIADPIIRKYRQMGGYAAPARQRLSREQVKAMLSELKARRGQPSYLAQKVQAMSDRDLVDRIDESTGALGLGAAFGGRGMEAQKRALNVYRAPGADVVPQPVHPQEMVTQAFTPGGQQELVAARGYPAFGQPGAAAGANVMQSVRQRMVGVPAVKMASALTGMEREALRRELLVILG